MFNLPSHLLLVYATAYYRPQRWYPSMPCSRSPGGWNPSMPCRFPGPHPGGKFRGIWPGGVSRPTPKGEVQGDLVRGGLQAHTRGSIPACTEADPPTATAVGGTHPIGMHSCFLASYGYYFINIEFLLPVFNQCESNPCINGGTCSEGFGYHKCDFLPGFKGDNCELSKIFLFIDIRINFYVSMVEDVTTWVADSRFPRQEDANPCLWGKNLLFYKIFAENCMKMKEIGPRGSANGLIKSLHLRLSPWPLWNTVWN